MFVQVPRGAPGSVPAVGGSGGREAGSDGVVEDVVDGAREVVVGVDETAGEAVAPEMARAGVLAVEALGVDAVESAEAVGEVLARTGDNEVHVVRHEAERDPVPALRRCDVSEEGQEAEVVRLVAEDRAAVDATGGDVVDAVGEEAARDSRHGSTVRATGVGEPGVGTIRDTLGTLDMAARAENQGQSLVFASFSARDAALRLG